MFCAHFFLANYFISYDLHQKLSSSLIVDFDVLYLLHIFVKFYGVLDAGLVETGIFISCYGVFREDMFF